MKTFAEFFQERHEYSLSRDDRLKMFPTKKRMERFDWITNVIAKIAEEKGVEDSIIFANLTQEDEKELSNMFNKNMSEEDVAFILKNRIHF